MKLLRRIWSVARNTGDLDAYGLVRPEVTEVRVRPQEATTSLILDTEPADPMASWAPMDPDPRSTQAN